jgi:3-hydroxyacyl-CoA dehydrogenase
MGKRIIKKAAVLGSGIMGAGIACHLANAGFEVLLLDLKSEGEKNPNKIADENLKNSIKSNPSPIYLKEFARRIRTGNFEDHMKEIAHCQWVIEVVVEKLEVKKKVFEQVEKFRKPGTLITSNTSGIPIHLMIEGRSEDFQKHFCGTHFFNPPRYLRLLELIPTPKTDSEVIEFLSEFGEKYLGKTPVICKDTPAFIANRIGVFGIMSLFHLVENGSYSVEEIDKLTGPVIGRPKSATFRTCDVVGLDTLVHVANGLKENLKKDEAARYFELPGYIRKMIENKWLGSKTKQGFYKKVKKENGESEIQALDLKTLEYKPGKKVKFPTLELTRSIDQVKDRMKVLIGGKDKAGEFYRKSFFSLFAYVSNRIPEISDNLYSIDEAMKAGFGWELGPFEYWDACGLKESLDAMQKEGYKPAAWVMDMVKEGNNSFYDTAGGSKKYFQPGKGYQEIPGSKENPSLDILKENKTVWKNSGCTLIDLGDGILNLEFHTKMNSIGGEILQGINTAIDMAEKDYRGLVIYNEGQNFSAGANVGMIFMMAVEQEWDELNFAIRAFQNTMMRVRYSSIPVVVATHNMALGGACELAMHSDKVLAHAETYMGLVEFGVGLIPGGGGTKEFALRLSDELQAGDIELNNFRDRFLTIGQAKVSTSAHEAFSLGYLNKKDEVIMARSLQLAEAKTKCLEIAEAGYTMPVKRQNIRVLGKQALGLAHLGAHSMQEGKYISEHDVKISLKLAFVLAGGDLSAPAEVSEDYLLDLEREAFLSLCSEKKTLERIQSILTGGKVLRN